MKCYHHNDLDGRCAAAIVLKSIRELGAWPADDLEFIEVDYKDAIDVDAIVQGEIIYIVDFSFKPEVMAQVLERTSAVIWIDHHVTAASYNYGRVLPGKRDFSNKGLSGCELAWLCFFHTEPPVPVRMIGDYDSWRLFFQPECFQFYEGMKLEKTGPGELIWKGLLNGDVDQLKKIMTNGSTAMQYRDNYCKDICRAYGYETEIDGHRAYAANLYRFGSQGFGHRFSQYPLCIAYIHDGRRFTVSLYSEQVDVSEIAKKHGGGGHKGAAGFVCSELPFKKP